MPEKPDLDICDLLYNEILEAKARFDINTQDMEIDPEVLNDRIAEYAMGCSPLTSFLPVRDRMLAVATMAFYALEKMAIEDEEEQDVYNEKAVELLEPLLEDLSRVTEQASLVLSKIFKEKDLSDKCDDCPLDSFCDDSTEECYFLDDDDDAEFESALAEMSRMFNRSALSGEKK